MVQGFIVDRQGPDGGALVSSWIEGVPKSSFWRGLKIRPWETGVPVGTFRCSACGFLESFARPEFGAK